MAMATLSKRALLVSLNISQWSARKYDRKVSKDVADRNGVALAVGNYNKVLLPMVGGHLKAVHQKSTEIRTHYYTNTLPWGIEGTQMLPSGNYLPFMTTYRKFKGEWEQLVLEFQQQYPDLKLQAQRVLGPLYKEEDYPKVQEIGQKFKMDLAVFPVPDTDIRCQIIDSEVQSIQQDIEARLQSASQRAMNEVWNRLFERVQHIASKLADPGAIFRDSMLENARELCALLPKLNFTDDPQLEQMRQEVEQQLVKNHPDSLRNDPDLRKQKADEAQAIMDKMKVFMGGV